MNTKKKREIEIEFERVRIIYKRKNQVWCSGCQAETELVTAHEAEAIAEIGEAEIMRLANSGVLHTNQVNQKNLLICLKSLLNKGNC